MWPSRGAFLDRLILAKGQWFSYRHNKFSFVSVHLSQSEKKIFDDQVSSCQLQLLHHPFDGDLVMKGAFLQQLLYFIKFCHCNNSKYVMLFSEYFVLYCLCTLDSFDDSYLLWTNQMMASHYSALWISPLFVNSCGILIEFLLCLF